MSRPGNVGLKLFLVSISAALVLSLANALLRPVIEKRKARDHREILIEVAKGGTPAEERPVKDSRTVKSLVPVKDKNGKVSAYVLGLSARGHGGEMSMYAGYKPDGEVLGVRLVEHQETPGLGAKAEDTDYMKKFVGKGTGKPIPVRKNQLSAADEVSGATMTFSGIGRAVEAGSDFVKNLGAVK